MKLNKYEILLERLFYFPGEIIRGTLTISSSQEISCRGIRVHLQGKGHSRFQTGSGDNRQTHTHTQFYTNCKRTVFGHVSATPVINDAGENAIFGPPWSPDEGVLYLNIPENVEEVMLRVMDHVWLKSDNVIGEINVNIFSVIGRGIQEKPLTRNGKPESGILEFSMDWEPQSDRVDAYGHKLKCLKVNIIKATNLRKAHLIGKNDVYVQGYARPEGGHIKPNHALPEPITTIKLPAGQVLSVPFQFQLPADLPSSIVKSNDNYITYSIYSNIDIAWQRDPSTRVFFTVMQPLPSYRMLTPINQSWVQPLYAQVCIPPCCCFDFCNCSLSCGCSAYGTMNMKISADRSGYAPGEVVTIKFDVECDWQEFENRIRSLSVDFNQNVTLWAENHNDKFSESMMPKIVVAKGQKSISFVVPAVPPTYSGGLGKDAGWFGKVARYGNRWGSAKPDPITWDYSLLITLIIAMPGFTLTKKRYTLNIPIGVSGMGLSALPAPSGYNIGGAATGYNPLYVSPVTGVSSMDRGDNKGGNVANIAATNQPQYANMNWNSDSRIVAAYPVVLSQYQLAPAYGTAQVIRDNDEDYNTTNVQALTYSPSYLMYAPSAPPAPQMENPLPVASAVPVNGKK